MKNKKIAGLMAKKLYGPSLDETDFAFQLFVEKVVMPPNVKSYTDKDMKIWILDFLSKK